MSVSYAPLREHLAANRLTPNRLYSAGVITTNTADDIRHDNYMTLRTLEKICAYLDIPIEQAVRFEPPYINVPARFE